MANDAGTSPWRFLRPLDADSVEDRELLTLTRHRELGAITQMVSSGSASILYAASGNGKTSVVNAGVIPHFTELGYAVIRTRPRPPWSLHTPSRAFVDCALREIHLPLFGPSDVAGVQAAASYLAGLSEPQTTALGSGLRQIEQKMVRFRTEWPESNRYARELAAHADLPVPAFLRQLRAVLEPGTRLLIVCDQFEELFVHYSNTRAMREFVDQLGEVSEDSALEARLLFSMREDWVGSMIEFRDAIPSIFSRYYKLNPLRRSQAGDALMKPLERLGIYFEEGVVTRLLDDLAAAYPRNESRSPASSDEDPFIELPALQVIADRMWASSRDQERPFSLDHYQSLQGEDSAAERRGKPKATVSIARVVLDRYLLDELERMPDDGHGPVAMRELRLDCLYLLTDQVKHRRALRWSRLLSELKKQRPSALDLPVPTRPLVEAALAPLLESRLVDRHEASDKEMQYELAHDFAVRAVVAAWKDLDRQRTMDLATRTRERKERDARFDVLSARERVAATALTVGTPAGFALLLALFVGMPEASDADTVGWWRAIWSGAVLFGALLAIAAVNATRASRIASVLGLTAVGVLGWSYSSFAPGLPQVVFPPVTILGDVSQSNLDNFRVYLASGTTLYAETDTAVDTVVRLMDRSGRELDRDDDSGEGVGSRIGTPIQESGDYFVEVSALSGSGRYRLTLSEQPDALTQPVPPIAAMTIEVEPNNSVKGSSSFWGTLAGPLLAVLCFVGAVLGYFRSLAHPWRREARRARAASVFGVMLAELADMLLLGSVLVASIVMYEEYLLFTGTLTMFIVMAAPVLTVAAVMAFMAWRYGRTPGHWLAGLRLAGRRLPPSRIITRQLLFLGWTLLNSAFALPWLVITPIVAARAKAPRGVYDVMARVEVEWADLPAQAGGAEDTEQAVEVKGEAA